MHLRRVINCGGRGRVSLSVSSNGYTQVPAWVLHPINSVRSASTAIEPQSQQPEDLQYLQRSTVPTMHFQRSLPRLPIPKLDKSLERYLRSLEPILTPNDLEQTRKYAQEFQDKQGKELHANLVATDNQNKQTSYISEYWFDMYLRAREPLVNPFISMNDDPSKPKMDQAVRAADLTTSALRFRNSLRKGILEPDVYHLNPNKSDTAQFRRIVGMLPSSISWYGAYLYKAFPLDMSQYIRLFNSTRIAKVEKDELFTDNSAQHIAVLCNGQFYTFDVYDKNGKILPGKDLLACFRHIIETAPATNKDSIAVLSGDQRNHWAVVRCQLVEAGNAEMLKKLDSAIFVLCLDGDDIKDVNSYCKSMLHGDGYNRWFEKSFSLIVDKTGRAGVNFEHAWGDGVAVLRVVNEMHKDAASHNFSLGSSSATVDPTSYVAKIDFHINDAIRKEIDQARTEFEESMKKVDLSILEYRGYGKEQVKKYNFYPDGMMQLAFQMAYWKQTSGVAATYESCSTAAFKHGRTECIRSATPLTKLFTEKLFAKKSAGSSASSYSDLKHLLKQCSDNHGQLTKEAAMGQGFDRHLFALKKLGEAEGLTMPLFTDPAYAKINHNILSTSTLQSPAIAAGGFAPVVADGYGIGYSCMDDWMGCVVFYYPATRNGKDFTEAIKESFDDIMRVMSAKPDAGPSNV